MRGSDHVSRRSLSFVRGGISALEPHEAQPVLKALPQNF